MAFLFSFHFAGLIVFSLFVWFFFSRPPVAAVKESYGRKSKGLPGLPSVHRSARKVLFPNDAFSEGIQRKDCLRSWQRESFPSGVFEASVITTE